MLATPDAGTRANHVWVIAIAHKRHSRRRLQHVQLDPGGVSQRFHVLVGRLMAEAQRVGLAMQDNELRGLHVMVYRPARSMREGVGGA